MLRRCALIQGRIQKFLVSQYFTQSIICSSIPISWVEYMTKTFAVIGGDLRNLKLAEHLAEDGHSVKIFGFKNIEISPKVTDATSLEEAIKDSDVVVGPIPCSKDEQTINCTFYNLKIYIDDVLRSMNKEQIFVAGFLSENIIHLCQNYELECHDILKREEMSVLNAIPTAEGAIQIALEEMPTTLHDSKVLVMGYGRIGKVLSKMLHGMGAKVYAAARKYSDLAWIETMGYVPIRTSEISTYLDTFDVIFNTIPHVVLEAKELRNVRKDSLIIDLASKPGGINFEKAKELGVKTIWALSLPGKVAPVSAARYMKDTIYNILNEEGKLST